MASATTLAHHAQDLEMGPIAALTHDSDVDNDAGPSADYDESASPFRIEVRDALDQAYGTTSGLDTGMTAHLPRIVRLSEADDPAARGQIREALYPVDLNKARWINMRGISVSARQVIYSIRILHDLTPDNKQELSKLYLDDAPYPSINENEETTQVIGGPNMLPDERNFIWLQTQVWFIGDRRPTWLSLRQVSLQIFLIPPCTSRPGVFITTFTGAAALVDEASSLFTDSLVESHPLGRSVVDSTWIMAYAFLRTLASELDFAFQASDPRNFSPKQPSAQMIDRLPGMMEQLSHLATVHRFLTSLEELTMFLTSIRKHLSTGTIETGRIRALANVEEDRTHTKIQEQRQLCQTHMRQFEHLVQMAISYNISSITSRLDGERQAAERLTKVGLVVGVIASVISPLGLLTSFYGMNVEEFAPGAGASLFQFWQIGLPLLILPLVTSAFVAVWMTTNGRA